MWPGFRLTQEEVECDAIVSNLLAHWHCVVFILSSV